MAGRGRLDSLDLLPEEAQDDVIWACGELNERRRTQADILFELNDRLEAKGIDAISRSAFNRRAMRLAKRTMQLDERRHLYAGIAKRLTPEAIGESDIVLAEFLKTLIDELLDGENLSPKNAMELARAYLAVVQAQHSSAKHRRDSEEERAKAQAAAKTKLGDAVDEVARTVMAERGMSKETIEAIKAKILGVKL